VVLAGARRRLGARVRHHPQWRRSRPRQGDPRQPIAPVPHDDAAHVLVQGCFFGGTHERLVALADHPERPRQPALLRFHLLAPGHVAERDGELAVAGAERDDFVRPAERRRARSKAGGLAREGHPAVALDPEWLDVRHDFPHGLAGDIGPPQPGHRLESRVGIQKPIVDRDACGVADDLVQGHAALRSVEQGVIAALALPQRGLSALALADIPGDGGGADDTAGGVPYG